MPKYLSVITAVDGSAAFPAVGFTNENGTGIYRSANQVISVVIASSPAMAISPSLFTLNSDVAYFEGQVGIGTSAPTQFLEVSGNAKIDADLYVTGNIILGTEIVFSDDSVLSTIATVNVAGNGTTSQMVTHNKGYYPIVQILDNTHALILPDTLVHNSINDFTVTFGENFNGTIIYR